MLMVATRNGANTGIGSIAEPECKCPVLVHNLVLVMGTDELRFHDVVNSVNEWSAGKIISKNEPVDTKCPLRGI